MTTLEMSQRVSPSILDPQAHFLTLLNKITQLQWVRESLPAQTKHYQSLKQQQEREVHLKSLLEKQILEYRKKQDASSGLLTLKRTTDTNKNEPTCMDLIERLQRCDRKLKDMENQVNAAQIMLHDLRLTKHTLDTHCLDLHTLYDEIVPRNPDDPSYIIEQHLKEEVTQLAYDIPQIEKDIHSHSTAQKKIYESRELMEKAMMTLPGASMFLDRHAGHRSTGNHPSTLFPTVLTNMTDISVPSLKDAEKLASEAYELELHASKLCKEVPLIPSSSFNRDDNVVTVLTAYRGYRLKLETILRTKLNPQLQRLHQQLGVTKYQYEQKTIEWIDQQIIMLEYWLRQNGGLHNVNLNREISMLRMGRVTIDDALETNDLAVAATLPEYSPRDHGRLPTPRSSLDNLPGYYSHPHQQQEDTSPPAYIG
ncbi:hypothetical protein BC941DRAFT_442358 [Chlamydoabsidia padenii]|nr:hypothetical protein BC941DRAFT_442358 [Chlamydoabsidia padenii]